eukprot:2444559-Alexandrium_andersonii.AAC.1
MCIRDSARLGRLPVSFRQRCYLGAAAGTAAGVYGVARGRPPCAGAGRASRGRAAGSLPGWPPSSSGDRVRRPGADLA